MATLTPTGLPFNVSRRAYDLALQAIPSRDLRAEIEAGQWLALDVSGDSRVVAELQLEALIAEFERRKALWTRSASDPLRPAWPSRDPDLPARVAAVKDRWPIVSFCTDLLGCDLRPAGQDRFTATCPLPGHRDDTPSFVIFAADDRAWCFGCQRGGDVIGLTGLVFGLERFFDQLERLEREAGR
jgi:hypothetical protein